MRLPRRTVVIAALAAGALVLLASGQTWVNATGLGSGAAGEVTADGSDASGVISAMAFVVLAGALALTIVRNVGRWTVAVLLALAGATLAVTAVQAVVDPAAAAEPAVSAVTGTTAAAADYAVTFWPWLAAAGGVLAALSGAAAAVAGGHWSHSRRFEAVPAVAGDVAGEGRADAELDPMDAWDELSAGHDPTR